MKLRRFTMVLGAAALITGLVPAAQAAAGEVTVQDPVRGCDYTVGWTLDTANVSGSRVYTSGTCQD